MTRKAQGQMLFAICRKGVLAFWFFKQVSAQKFN